MYFTTKLVLTAGGADFVCSLPCLLLSFFGMQQRLGRCSRSKVTASGDDPATIAIAQQQPFQTL